MKFNSQTQMVIRFSAEMEIESKNYKLEPTTL